MLTDIIDATSQYNPTVILEPTEDYPSLQEGEFVIEYDADTCLVYESGTYQISYKDWMGDYENPIPVLQLILGGFVEEFEDEKGQVQLMITEGHGTPLWYNMSMEVC